MRLDPREREAIVAASLRHFGVRPRLFGSRVHDDRRGGDIDLYIETAAMPVEQAVERELRMAADLYLALGERKIDIVVDTGRSDLPIHRVARDEGVWL